jgi:hypothetical protein
MMEKLFKNTGPDKITELWSWFKKNLLIGEFIIRANYGVG